MQETKVYKKTSTHQINQTAAVTDACQEYDHKWKSGPGGQGVEGQWDSSAYTNTC